MTVSSELSRKTYIGDGSTTSFDTNPMVFFDDVDLTVYVVTTATGAVVATLTLGTHYTVTGGDGSTGTVDTSAGSSPYGAHTAAQTLVIVRELAITQGADFVNNDASDAEVAEDALDRLTMICQELDTRLDRSFTLPDSDVTGASTELPTPSSNKIIGWNSAGLALENKTPADISLVAITSFIATLIDDASAAEARLTLGVSTPNLCLNPGMQVWQNDRTLAAAAHGTVLADGWLWGAALGTAAFTLSRGAEVPDSSVPYSIKVDCTTADAAPAAGVERHIRYAVYGYNLAPYVSTDLVLKFSVKSSKTGTYCVAAVNEARDRTYVVEYTISVANTWEEKTVTIPLSTKTGTWNSEHGFGIGIRFALVAGSTYRTTANAWQTGNFVGTANQVNIGDDTANDFFLTKVQVCPTAAGPFVLPEYSRAWDDARKQYRVFDCAVAGVNFYGFAPNTGSVNFDIPLGGPMWAAPAISVRGVLDTDVQLQTTAGVAVTGGTLTSFARSKDFAKWSYEKAASFTAGTTYVFRLETTTGKLVVNGHLA